MNVLSNLKKGIENPSKVAIKINKKFHGRSNNKGYYEDGMDIFSEDWDNLIILDACRYDIFDQEADLAGDLQRRHSRATATKQFITANFSDRVLNDTVYVSANGWYVRLKKQIESDIHDFIGLHTDDYRGNQFHTTLPETVTEHAKQAIEQYPNKRIIVHYVQPHTPYIGDRGQQYFGKTEETGLQDTMSGSSIPRWQLEEAYRENLQEVLPDVEELLSDFRGKTVVTSDHGELLGERISPIPIAGFGHPLGIYEKKLLEVPWLVTDFEDRREIIAEENQEQEITQTEMEETVDHLEDLGYAV